MFKELANLVKLQKTDNELIEINELKGDLPQIVEALQNTIATLTSQLEEEGQREKEITLETKEHQNEIEDNQEYLKKYQDQLYLVTSNKEYDALTSEIDTMKQNIDKSEYSILELSEELENLKESIKSKELTLADKKAELIEREAQLEKMTKKTSDVQAKLQKEREEIVKSIPLRYKREYDRIAKAKQGLAIVPIQQLFNTKQDRSGNVEYIPAQVSCGGCHKIVPPQKVVEIRAGTKLIRCEFCGRILYWDEDASEIRTSTEEEII